MERAVVELRYGLKGGHPLRTADVAERLGLTARETAEIEKRAFERLRELLDRDALKALLERVASSEKSGTAARKVREPGTAGRNRRRPGA